MTGQGGTPVVVVVVSPTTAAGRTRQLVRHAGTAGYDPLVGWGGVGRPQWRPAPSPGAGCGGGSGGVGEEGPARGGRFNLSPV